jgi:hypothetical protein
MSLESRVIKSDTHRSWWGLAAGFLVSIHAISVGGYLAYQSHDTAGATIATASLAGLVGTFIYGTRSQRQERIGRFTIQMHDSQPRFPDAADVERRRWHAPQNLIQVL